MSVDREPIVRVSSKEMFVGDRRYFIDRQENFNITFVHVLSSAEIDVTGRASTVRRSWGLLEPPVLGQPYAIAETHRSNGVDGWGSVCDTKALRYSDLQQIFRAAQSGNLFGDARKTKQVDRLLLRTKAALSKTVLERTAAEAKRAVERAHGERVRASASATVSHDVSLLSVKGSKLWLRKGSNALVGYELTSFDNGFLFEKTEIKRLSKSLIEKSDMHVQILSIWDYVAAVAFLAVLSILVWWFFLRG